MKHTVNRNRPRGPYVLEVRLRETLPTAATQSYRQRWQYIIKCTWCGDRNKTIPMLYVVSLFTNKIQYTQPSNYPFPVYICVCGALENEVRWWWYSWLHIVLRVFVIRMLHIYVIMRFIIDISFIPAPVVIVLKIPLIISMYKV